MLFNGFAEVMSLIRGQQELTEEVKQGYQNSEEEVKQGYEKLEQKMEQGHQELKQALQAILASTTADRGRGPKSMTSICIAITKHLIAAIGKFDRMCTTSCSLHDTTRFVVRAFKTKLGPHSAGCIIM
jgi:dsDNA-specific endonuclease/ATPase MutS2